MACKGSSGVRLGSSSCVVGLRAWLSLYSSTTMLAPKMAYCSSRRTHWYSPAGDHSRAGRTQGVERHKHRIQGRGGRLAGWPVRWRAASVTRWRRLRVALGRAEAVAGEGLVQRRPSGAELGRGRVDAAQPLGQGEGAFDLGPIRVEPAGLPAHPLLGIQGPLVGAGEGWISIRRGLTACSVLRKDGVSRRRPLGP